MPGTSSVLLCELNSEGSLNKTEELIFQINQINLSLNKTRSCEGIKFMSRLKTWCLDGKENKGNGGN